MDMSTLVQLEYVVVLADELHFGRAADKLLVSTSSISRKVCELERELGVELFDRSTRRVHVTPGGAVIIDQARRVLREVSLLRDIADKAAAGHTGLMKAAYSPAGTNFVRRLASTVRERFPELEIRLEQHGSVDVADAVL